MKKRFKITIITLSMALFVLLSMPSLHADVGNTFSGGGSSSGGSSGSSSSSWSGGFSGSSGRTHSNGSISSVAGCIIVFGGIIVLASIASSFNKNRQNSNSYRTGRKVLPEAKVVENILNVDPNFILEIFKTQVSETYLTLQEAWEKKDWEQARKVESDVLFNVHQRQIQEYIDRGLTNHLDMQNILNVSLTSFKQEGNLDVISVRLAAELIDYTSEDATGKVIYGNKTTHQKRVYHLEFVRISGQKTDQSIKEKLTNCPNCGAPIESEDMKKCPYCQSVFIKQKAEWLINKYEEW